MRQIKIKFFLNGRFFCLIIMGVGQACDPLTSWDNEIGLDIGVNGPINLKGLELYHFYFLRKKMKILDILLET